MKPYVELDDTGEPIKTRCVRCNDTIATAKAVNNRMVLVPWSHYKPTNVQMVDGTVANLPTCTDCFNQLKATDFPDIEKQLRYGWMRQQAQVYRDHPEKRKFLTNAGQTSRTKKILRRI